MSIYVNGIIWVVGAAFVTGVFAYLVRRIGASDGTVENNEAAGQVFTIVGGLQAVLVAFVLISLFDGLNAAEDGAYHEADALVATSWAADALPDPARTHVRDLTRSYAATVADREWPVMQNGGEISNAGWAQLDELRTAISDAPAEDDWAIDRKTEAASQVWEVYQARQARLTAASDAGVSSVVWFALIAGSIMAVGLPLLFGGPRPFTHIIIVSILAGTLSLLLYATYQLQNPFSGGARIDPDAFRSALARLG